jgi:hypothetical protein
MGTSEKSASGRSLGASALENEDSFILASEVSRKS